MLDYDSRVDRRVQTTPSNVEHIHGSELDRSGVLRRPFGRESTDASRSDDPSFRQFTRLSGLCVRMF